MKKLTLPLILVLASLLRIFNLNIGSPILYLSNDEAIYHLSALNMLAEKTPFSLGNYGPLGSYIQIPFLIISFLTLLIQGKLFSVSDMEFLLVTQEGLLLFIPRLISALFGVASVYLSYKVAKQLFSSGKAALWSSLFSAVSFNLVHTSHLARAWSPAIFFVLLALFMVLKKKFTLAFIFSAISFGFHPVSGISVLLILFYQHYIKQLSRETFRNLAIWFSLVILFTTLSLGNNFFTIINPAFSKAGLMKLPASFTNSKELFDYIFNIKFHLLFWKELILSDGIIIILSLFFLIKNFKKNNFIPLILFLAVNLLMSVYFYIPLIRYFLPAFVILPILAGKIIADFDNGSTKRSAIIFLLIIFASFNSIYWNYLLFQKPTFTQVREWIDKNIDPQVVIASSERRNFDYVPNAKSSQYIREFKPNYYRKAANAVGDGFPRNVRNIIYLNEYGHGSKTENFNDAYKKQKIALIIDSYWREDERIVGQKSPYPLTLVAHFSPTGNVIQKKEIPSILFDSGFIFARDFSYPLLTVDRAGPYFDVLKVEN